MFEKIIVYVEYKNFPQDRTLTARVRQHSAQEIVYGRNLLKHYTGEDINSALSECCKHLRGKARNVEFIFESRLHCQPIVWTL